MQIPESELVINPDGSIYHLNLHPEQLASTIITVGDPNRVATVSNYFDTIEYKVEKREFITHTGTFNGHRLTVISTGIGTDNIDIVLTELDALANIDLNTRTVKTDFTQLTFVRLGTSGCLQPHLPVDSIVISRYGIGIDGLMNFYESVQDEDEKALNDTFSKVWKNEMIKPYTYRCDDELAAQFADFQQGMTLTCLGFYAPQNRQVRAKNKFNGWLDALSDFSHKGYAITNLEMETAGIFGLSKILGHRAISANVLLANRANKTFSANPKKSIDNLIVKSLAVLCP